MELNKRYAVFSIRRAKGGSVWTRAGSAWLNKDGSMNLYLDVLPLDGTLHVREPGEKRDAAPVSAVVDSGEVVSLASMGGH